MLEHYFLKPDTVDRIRQSWIGEPIERYVTWLHEHHYSARNVYRRVPLLCATLVSLPRNKGQPNGKN